MKKFILTVVSILIFTNFLLCETLKEKVEKRAESYYHFLKYSKYMADFNSDRNEKSLKLALNEITKAYELNKSVSYLLFKKIETEIKFFSSEDTLSVILNEIENYEKKHPGEREIHKLKALLYTKLARITKDEKKATSYFKKGIEEKEKYIEKKVYPPFNMDVGLYYFNKGDLEKALKVLKPLEKTKTSEGIYATLFLADIYYNLGKYEKSLELVKWYSSFFGLSKDLIRLEIKNYTKLNKLEEVDKLYKQLIGNSPTSEDLLQYANFLTFLKKDCEKALKVLKEIDKKDIENNVNFKLPYLKIKFSALDCVKRKLEALQTLEEILKTDKNGSWVIKYGEYCRDIGNSNEAIKIFEGLIKNFKSKSKAYKYVFYQLLYLYSRCGYYKKLIELSKKIKFEKMEDFPYELLFEALLKSKNYVKLIEILENLKLKKNLNDDLKKMVKLYEKILQFFQKGRYLNVEEFEIFLKKIGVKKRGINFANVYYNMINRRDLLLKYLKIHKNELEKWEYLNLISSIYLQDGDIKKLKEIAPQIEKITPKNYLDYNNIGYILIVSEVNIKKGIEYVKKALQEKPMEPMFLDSLAWGYYKLGKYKKAYEIIKEAMANGGNFSEIYEHGGDIAFKLKFYSDAKKYYEMALKTAYDKKSKDKIKRKLNGIKKPILIRLK